MLDQIRWVKLLLTILLTLVGFPLTEDDGVVKVELMALKMSFFSPDAFLVASFGGFSM